jgi:hypothetical protein
LYILVTARAVRRRFAQAQGSTGNVPSVCVVIAVPKIHVYTSVVGMSSKFWPLRLVPLAIVSE